MTAAPILLWSSWEHPHAGTVHGCEVRAERPKIRLEIRLEEFGWEVFLFAIQLGEGGRPHVVLMNRLPVPSANLDHANLDHAKRIGAEAWKLAQDRGEVEILKEDWIRRFGTPSERAALAVRDRRNEAIAKERAAKLISDRKNGHLWRSKGRPVA